MTEFFEFHDSSLEGIEQFVNCVVLRLNAYRHLWDGDVGTGWMQRIVLTIEKGKVEGTFANFPVLLSGGSFRAETCVAAPFACVDSMIPGTLSGCSRVEIQLQGYENDGNGKFGTVRICGDSAAITSREPAVFVEELSAAMNPNSLQARNRRQSP